MDLDLRDNEITQFPESFEKLKALQKLDARNNLLKTIPICIWPLESLRNHYLKFDGNPLDSKSKKIIAKEVKDILEFCREQANIK